MSAADPLDLLTDAVAKNSQILISVRNNKKLLCRVKAFDKHFNMVLEQVTEVWTESLSQAGSKTKKQVTKDRFLSKMFLRGDSVILVVSEPTKEAPMIGQSEAASGPGKAETKAEGEGESAKRKREELTAPAEEGEATGTGAAGAEGVAASADEPSAKKVKKEEEEEEEQ